jgi:hypothetical protein
VDDLHAFISSLALPQEDKKRLLNLTPATYTGMAGKLIKTYQIEI